MAEKDHAPTREPARTLTWLGRGLCPDCQTDLQPSGNSSYTCPECETSYPVAGGVP